MLSCLGKSRKDMKTLPTRDTETSPSPLPTNEGWNMKSITKYTGRELDALNDMFQSKSGKSLMYVDAHYMFTTDDDPSSWSYNFYVFYRNHEGTIMVNWYRSDDMLTPYEVWYSSSHREFIKMVDDDKDYHKLPDRLLNLK
jgi:hypothetical protein